MGAGALIAPLGFVIGADLATPKIRAVISVMINVSTQFGSIMASCFTIFLSSSAKYVTKNLANTSEEYQRRTILSFRDACICSISTYCIGMIIVIFLLPESHPRLTALRQLKKMGVKVPKSKETQAQPMWEVLI